uniref:Uncharacterized protein n=1 Tax=Arundo donax TaxID=35708 RepID=A0A0A9F229_ARUDO
MVYSSSCITSACRSSNTKPHQSNRQAAPRTGERDPRKSR